VKLSCHAMLPKTHDAVINRLEKRCCDCRQLKPLDQFHVNRDMPDGRQYRCKTCRALYDAERRLAHSSINALLSHWKAPAVSVTLVEVVPRAREAVGS
jgi:hypothetical protein